MRATAYLVIPTFLLALLPSASFGQETIAEATSFLRAEFRRLDSNGDRKLDETEFFGRGGNGRVLKRDFALYDFDSSGFLSTTEFAAVADLVEPELRGKIPDPMDELVAAAVAALDESYEGWNQRPRELVNAHTFVANFLSSISPGSKLFVTGRILRQADQDADGRLSRTEAKRFLQQQLGFRWYGGPPLREATGRLVRFDRFLDIDADQSGSLSHDEYMRASADRDQAQSEFRSGDLDHNGQISYAEFADRNSNHYFDPILWFRDADQNLDGQLDREEMFAASDLSRRHLVASTFAGFDSNGDGELGLQEYRLSMHANVNFHWNHRPVDGNRDGRLSYAEFQFHSFDLFHLQRRYFFHRLDRDGNGYLSDDEFAFESRLPDGVHVGSLDGKQTRLLFRDPDYPHCGWPMMSPDGSSVLFHRQRPDDKLQGQIFRIDIESGQLNYVIDGLQPSWSRDGRRIVCSRMGDRREIWIVDISGDEGKRVSEGWSAKWSPDGRMIAYLHDNGLWIHDVASGENRALWQRDQHEYLDLGDDVAWSPDSQRIAVTGRTTQRSEVVLVSPRDGDRSRIHQTEPAHRIVGQMDWSHQRGLVFRIHDQIHETFQLVTIDPSGKTAPTAIDWLEGNRWKSACISPDGLWYTAISDE